jgi:hypothetical protein
MGGHLRKKCCTRSSEHDRQGTLTPLALGVPGSKRGSWWLGALAAYLKPCF